MILHWLGDMFDPALAGYWGTRDLDAGAWTSALGIIARASATRSTASRSRCSTRRRSRLRRRLPAGVRMFTGDDFNYAELIAGDGDGHSRRAARHLRRDRAGGERRADGAGGGRPRTIRRDYRADRAAVAAHLRRADALLQDRRRLHRLAQRPPGRTSAWSAASRARAASCTLPSCSGWPMRRACWATGAGGAAHDGAVGPARHRIASPLRGDKPCSRPR